MNVHKQVKAIRLLLGLTQAELGEKSKATQKQISLIEGGQDCYVSTLRNMLQAMGYDLVAVPVEQGEGAQNADRNQGM